MHEQFRYSLNRYTVTVSILSYFSLEVFFFLYLRYFFKFFVTITRTRRPTNFLLTSFILLDEVTSILSSKKYIFVRSCAVIWIFYSSIIFTFLMQNVLRKYIFFLKMVFSFIFLCHGSLCYILTVTAHGSYFFDIVAKIW